MVCVLSTSQVMLMVKNLPASAGDIADVGSVPGWEDPLEEGMTTHSSVLGESQGQKSLVGCSSSGPTELDMTEVT